MPQRLQTVSHLAKSTDAADFLAHHRNVVSYWNERKTKQARLADLARGKMWTDAEQASATQRNKVLLGFNILKPQERTVLGLFIQNRFDVKFAPRQPDDPGMASVFEQLRIWDSYTQDDEMLDIELIRRAWAMGDANQECWMDVAPGRESIMRTANVSNFCTYWDPDSVVVGSRSDARFVDIDSFLSVEDLVSAMPQKADEILAAAEARGIGVSGGYQKPGSGVHSGDRDAESIDYRNGKFRVSERYYRVNTRVVNYYDNEYRPVDAEFTDMAAFQSEYPGGFAQYGMEEELWYCCAVPGLLRNDFLCNRRYHAQPRDPDTGAIMWPILEMVAESFEGEATGFIEQQQDVVRAVQSMLSNAVNAAKHAASQAQLIDKSAFESEKEAKRFAQHHSDADAGFFVKPGRKDDAAGPVDRGSVAPEVFRSLEMAKLFSEEISSTPPSLKGFAQNEISGVLNAQQIEQAVIQLQVLVKNYRDFLKRRAQLRFAYWSQFYTYPKVFRVLDKESQQKLGEFMSVNEPQMEVDAYGEPTGRVVLGNAIQRDIPYDVVVEEGQKTNTYRMRIQAQLSEMMQSPVTQMDPVLASFMLMEYLRLSDVNPELKQSLQEHSSILAQDADRKRQMEAQMGEQAAQQAQQQAQATETFAGLDAAQKQMALEKTQLENEKLATEIAQQQVGTAAGNREPTAG